MCHAGVQNHLCEGREAQQEGPWAAKNEKCVEERDSIASATQAQVEASNSKSRPDSVMERTIG
jgi:hypothetical protein